MEVPSLTCCVPIGGLVQQDASVPPLHVGDGVGALLLGGLHLHGARVEGGRGGGGGECACAASIAQ